VKIVGRAAARDGGEEAEVVAVGEKEAAREQRRGGEQARPLDVVDVAVAVEVDLREELVDLVGRHRDADGGDELAKAVAVDGGGVDGGAKLVDPEILDGAENRGDLLEKLGLGDGGELHGDKLVDAGVGGVVDGLENEVGVGVADGLVGVLVGAGGDDARFAVLELVAQFGGGIELDVGLGGIVHDGVDVGSVETRHGIFGLVRGFAGAKVREERRAHQFAL
jgi:hypothetical protein